MESGNSSPYSQEPNNDPDDPKFIFSLSVYVRSVLILPSYLNLKPPKPYLSRAKESF
jgi:hypothetical protein